MTTNLKEDKEKIEEKIKWINIDRKKTPFLLKKISWRTAIFIYFIFGCLIILLEVLMIR